ncbi:HIT family protein [Legionella hackeliae]|uniref:Histidine triad (HIT) protein n=1 Tax=Legionella hackeliae TaxID=449 RepID=A0A0A8UMK3_LEGHA|nr:HIT family protein [Legionella hackeliae]KTD10474.1 Histidine triad (HIT) protein [Legionella hackeliae]CEK09978.1 Histidine triad (HIT) protein [Legionella hackeliae]STX49890.1 Histidine triad (HIT) protein [Legionella hackeliae]
MSVNQSKREKCIIDAIVNKQEKASIVFEDEYFIAFLDHRPLFPGHTLLAPKEHIQTFYDLPPSLTTKFSQLIQVIGKAVEHGMEAEGSFIAMNNKISQSIPHLHAHIVPRNKGDGLKGFFWPRMKYQNEQHLIETQEKIKQHLNAQI